jgi:hypothetical protein
MRLYSDEMDKLYSSFKIFFERRDFLDQLANSRDGAYSLSTADLFERAVAFYKERLLTGHSITSAEAIDEIEEFLSRYKIYPMPKTKEARLRDLRSLDRHCLTK